MLMLFFLDSVHLLVTRFVCILRLSLGFWFSKRRFFIHTAFFGVGSFVGDTKFSCSRVVTLLKKILQCILLCLDSVILLVTRIVYVFRDRVLNFFLRQYVCPYVCCMIWALPLC